MKKHALWLFAVGLITGFSVMFAVPAQNGQCPDFWKKENAALAVEAPFVMIL
jgi:hypothetical protein